jgi:hypothetical protein
LSARFTCAMQQEQGVAHMSDIVRQSFRQQADACRLLRSPLTAAVVETLADSLDQDTRTGARTLGWQGDPLAEVVSLRLAGALHALARSGRDAELSGLYAQQQGDFSGILQRVLSEWDDWLYPWLDNPPQTNEVGRSGALMPGLMVAAKILDMPIELLEIGASAGLNLNLDRFHYYLGGHEFGPADAKVRLSPQWQGAAPEGEWPRITSRTGVDQNPLDVNDDGVAERLLAYCWPDQQERLARLEAAITLACTFPPEVECGDAADWIEARLTEPQAEGCARIVMHSVFWQYVPAAAQARIEAAILGAAKQASAARPLGWLSFEPDPGELGPMQLRLKPWPSGEDLHLATCHPHGTWVEWLLAAGGHR